MAGGYRTLLMANANSASTARLRRVLVASAASALLGTTLPQGGPIRLPGSEAAAIALTSMSSKAHAQLYAPLQASPTITEYPVTNGSSPESITAGPDGNVWWGDQTAGLTGRITTGGAVTEFPSPGADGIAAGPDGNLWSANGDGNEVTRMTPTGTATTFSNGITPGAILIGITPGPDGNLWFTEADGNQIGRITPSGVVTEFSNGITAESEPYEITAGGDGNLWFTEAAGNRIGRITPSGVVTEFSTGITAGSLPVGITAGPDGNIWFTEQAGNRIGRITPVGTVTEFSSGITANSGLEDITAGQDGNLWFAEGNANQIGRITPGGLVTEFSSGITANSDPVGISSGPDGNIWFTEHNANQIGRVAVSNLSEVTGVKAIGPDGKALKCPPSYGTASCAGGPFSGGTQVTITGVNFQRTSTVTFGGTPALSQTFKNSHTIIAYSPPVNFYSLPVDTFPWSNGQINFGADVYVQVRRGCCSESQPSESSRFTYYVPQIGALIYNGGTEVCTAAVVTSATHATANTILTAGHCVANGGTTSGPGSFNSNFEFAPGYYGPISCPGAPSLSSPYSLKCGTAPYEIWKSVSLVVASDGWLDNNHCESNPPPGDTCDHTYDFGYIDFKPKHGVSVSATVGGGIQITWNPQTGENWTLFGDNLGGNVYGTESAFALRQCTGPDVSTTSDSQLIVDTSECSALIIPGDSGGPWINDSNGGVVHGIGAVNSQLVPAGLGGCPGSSTGCVFGTYLGVSAEVAFNSM